MIDSANSAGLFDPVSPRPKPDLADCVFYTCMDFPDGETIENRNWDIRGRFPEYIGGVSVEGKTVLDVGAASGFLTFSAEQAGASKVTALDARSAAEFHRIPFKNSEYSDDRARWIENTEVYLEGLKNSFWYAWHKFDSKAETVYAPAADLWKWKRRFDVVIAGAIVEHFSDPIPFIENLTKLANETLVIAFTPILPTEEILMKAMNAWDNPEFNYSWWDLSLGLYKRILTNLGFSAELRAATALCNEYTPPMEVERPTLIARRL